MRELHHKYIALSTGSEEEERLVIASLVREFGRGALNSHCMQLIVIACS